MDYTPYLDDTMTRIIGNRPYASDVEARARDKALKAYNKVIMKKTYPYVRADNAIEYGVPSPYGYGYSEKYMERTKDQALRDKLAKYNALEKQTRDLYAARQVVTPAERLQYMKEQYKLKKAAKMPAVAASGIATMAKAKRKYTAALNQLNKGNMRKHQKYMDAAKALKGPKGGRYSAKFLATPEGAQYMKLRDELKLLKQEIKARRAELKTPKGGLCAARGLIYARGTKPVVQARAAGFLGTIASLAVPLAREGVKWVGKRLKQKIEKKRAAEALRYPKKTPLTADDAWRKAYAMIDKAIPGLFTDQEQAKSAIKDFIASHATKLLGAVPTKPLTPIAPGNATVGEVVASMAPKETRAEFINALPQPAGSGVLEEALSLLSMPETRQALSSAAQLVVPKITKRIGRFLKGKLLKRKASKAPKTTAAPTTTLNTKPVGGEIMQGIPTPTRVPFDTIELSTAYATPGSVGPATADAYRFGGDTANIVYEMAKKM